MTIASGSGGSANMRSISGALRSRTRRWFTEPLSVISPSAAES